MVPRQACSPGALGHRHLRAIEVAIDLDIAGRGLSTARLAARRDGVVLQLKGASTRSRGDGGVRWRHRRGLAAVESEELC